MNNCDWPKLIEIKRSRIFSRNSTTTYLLLSQSSSLFVQCLLLAICITMTTIVGCNAWDIENNYNIRVNDHGFELTQANNLQRQEMIQRHCENVAAFTSDELLTNTPEDQLDHLLIDPKHKFLYCYVPKVACTNWKRILMLMTDQWANGTDPLKIPASIAHSPGM